MFTIKDRVNQFDRIMAAISFAEADEREMAMEAINRRDLEKKKKRARITVNRQKQERPDMRI